MMARQQGSWGQHGAHLGPTGPGWAPCWPHEFCYLGGCIYLIRRFRQSTENTYLRNNMDGSFFYDHASTELRNRFHNQKCCSLCLLDTRQFWDISHIFEDDLYWWRFHKRCILRTYLQQMDTTSWVLTESKIYRRLWFWWRLRIY